MMMMVMMKKDEEEEEGGEELTLKSNNPNLTGGEKYKKLQSRPFLQHLPDS